MSGRTKVLIPLVAAIIISILLASYIFLWNKEGSKEYVFKGSMLINDSGIPTGGFEWVGEYNVTLLYSSGAGRLIITQVKGLGDYIEKHVYNVSGLAVDGETLSFYMDGNKVVLKYLDRDNLWGSFDGYYVARYSINESYNLGVIKPGFIKGIPNHFYIEIRLTDAKTV